MAGALPEVARSAEASQSRGRRRIWAGLLPDAKHEGTTGFSIPPPAGTRQGVEQTYRDPLPQRARRCSEGADRIFPTDTRGVGPAAAERRDPLLFRRLGGRANLHDAWLRFGVRCTRDLSVLKAPQGSRDADAASAHGARNRFPLSAAPDAPWPLQ